MRQGLALFLLFLAAPGFGGPSILSQDGVQALLLSPTGEHFALLKRQAVNDQLFIVNVAETKVVVRRLPGAPNRIHSIAWIDGQRLAAELGMDTRYEQKPQRTGMIEILSLSNESTLLGGNRNHDTELQEILAGHSLILVDGLPRSPGIFLAASHHSEKLWRIDIDSDSVEVLPFPPVQAAEFAASANSKYIIATGVDETGTERCFYSVTGSDSGWVELDPDFDVVSISSSGMAYVRKPDQSGVLGLVSISLSTLETKTLFQDDVTDVARVLIDGADVPFAVQFSSGNPDWIYQNDDHPLAGLHKSLMQSSPDGDVLIGNLNLDGSVFVAEVLSENVPSRFLLIDAYAGRSQRLLESQSGLMIVGGEDDETYGLSAFSVQSQSDSVVSGYISSPKKSSRVSRPTVVMMPDLSQGENWKWGFDEEIWFFNRLGFNAVLVNSRGAAEFLDIEAAIEYSVDKGFTDPERVCLYGRGSGAETVLRMAIEYSRYECVISMGGAFSNTDFVLTPARTNGVKPENIKALFIYGQDEADEDSLTREGVQRALAANDIEVFEMSAKGERSKFSIRRNEVWAFARLSSFLKSNIGFKKSWPTLPLTSAQSVAMNEVLEAYMDRSQQGFYDGRNWRRWFESNDGSVRKSMSDDQLQLYRAYVTELIAMRRDSDSPEFNRPMGPIRAR